MTWSAFNAEVDAADVDQALREEARGHEQRHRERDLRRGERRAEARAARAPDGWPAWPLSDEIEVRPRAVERREQSEQQAGADRQRRGERDSSRIERDVDRVGGVGRQQRRHEIERPLRDEQAGRAAEEREQHDSASS